jgi:RNA polymerase sigma-70 factor (ECF subfamily)
MESHELFEILVREHAPMLTLYLRCAVRDAALVDDLFQETLLTAWKNLDRFDRSRPFGPWLRGIAGKLVLAHRRKAARAIVMCNEDVLEHLESRHAALHAVSGDTLDEKLAGLRDCINALPDRYRRVVELRYREQLQGEPLAERLGLTMETLKKQLQRARARLLDCLERKLPRIESTA